MVRSQKSEVSNPWKHKVNLKGIAEGVNIYDQF